MKNAEKSEKKKGGKVKFVLLAILIFVISFIAGIASKTLPKPWAKDFKVDFTDKIGTVIKDIPYGEKDSNKFDLYLPADKSKENYGLVVYLHAGGFTSGDKSDDKSMLEWLTSKGFVATGINYTLRSENNSSASVYSQSMEIKDAVPKVVEAAKERGYNIDRMAMMGGSAGHALAMLYAYRDAKDSPVPVKAVMGAVGPSSFYPEDWTSYGFDARTEETDKAAAGLFGVMAGKEIKPEWFDTEKYDEEMKDISALLWVDENSVPSLMAYGAYDKVQPFLASKRLDERLTKYNVPHDYLVFAHSGHGLQNDSELSHQYAIKIEEYLNKYMKD